MGRAQESRRHGSRGGSTAVLPRTAGTPPHSALGDGPSGGMLWSLHSSLYPPPAGRVGVCPRGLLSQVFGLFLLHEGRASRAWYRNGAAGSDFGYAHPPPRHQSWAGCVVGQLCVREPRLQVPCLGPVTCWDTPAEALGCPRFIPNLGGVGRA